MQRRGGKNHSGDSHKVTGYQVIFICHKIQVRKKKNNDNNNNKITTYNSTK